MADPPGRKNPVKGQRSRIRSSAILARRLHGPVEAVLGGTRIQLRARQTALIDTRARIRPMCEGAPGHSDQLRRQRQAKRRDANPLTFREKTANSRTR